MFDLSCKNLGMHLIAQKILSTQRIDNMNLALFIWINEVLKNSLWLRRGEDIIINNLKSKNVSNISQVKKDIKINAVMLIIIIFNINSRDTLSLGRN